MSKLSVKLRDELRALIPTTIFFIITFELLALTEALMLKQYGISVSGFLTATFMALVVAKVVLIADHIPLVNRFPHKPLIYNIVWKTVIYFVALFALRYIEHLVHFWRKSESLSDANSAMLDAIIWPRFWCVQIWLLVLLLVYTAFRELVYAIGRDKIVRMFFKGPMPK